MIQHVIYQRLASIKRDINSKMMTREELEDIDDMLEDVQRKCVGYIYVKSNSKSELKQGGVKHDNRN